MGLCLLKKRNEEDDIYQAILERKHYLGGTPVSEFTLVLFLPSTLSTWKEILQNGRLARCSQGWRIYMNFCLCPSDRSNWSWGLFGQAPEYSLNLSQHHLQRIRIGIQGPCHLQSLSQNCHCISVSYWSLSYPCLYLINSLLLYFQRWCWRASSNAYSCWWGGCLGGDWWVVVLTQVLSGSRFFINQPSEANSAVLLWSNGLLSVTASCLQTRATKGTLPLGGAFCKGSG